MRFFNTQVYGLERAVKAVGNSYRIHIDTSEPTDEDFARAQKLGPKDGGHNNFLTGIQVVFDVKYPQYWSMQLQRYHFIQIISSTSKMHTLIKNAATPGFDSSFNEWVDDDIVQRLRDYAEKYNKEECPAWRHFYFMKMVSNCPMGYELEMTISTNYLQLKTIYNQRKNHALSEDWGAFCKWCETLPLFCELTGVKESK